MKEPQPRKSRLVLAGAVIALAVAATGGFMLGQGAVAVDRAPAVTAAVPPVSVVDPTVSASSPSQIVDRPALIALAASASDATARGERTTRSTTVAVQSRFSVAIAFGCGGALGERDVENAGWRYDPASGALRVQFPMTRWSPQAWWTDDRSSDVETIEGFWIPRPWTTAETCPVAVTDPILGIEPVTLAGQTLAIGQVFAQDGRRSGRRDGQPYLVVKRVAPDAVQTARGFRLRLSGRLASFPEGGPMRCRQPGGPDQRPVCLVAASFDEVTIENAATGETIGRWTDSVGSPAN